LRGSRDRLVPVEPRISGGGGCPVLTRQRGLQLKGRAFQKQLYKACGRVTPPDSGGVDGQSMILPMDGPAPPGSTFIAIFRNDRLLFRSLPRKGGDRAVFSYRHLGSIPRCTRYVSWKARAPRNCTVKRLANTLPNPKKRTRCREKRRTDVKASVARARRRYGWISAYNSSAAHAAIAGREGGHCPRRRKMTLAKYKNLFKKAILRRSARRSVRKR